MKLMKLLPYFMTLLVMAVFVAGCGDDSTDEPVDITVLNPPSGVKVKIYSASGTSAQVSWTESSDEGLSDFKGYVVVTNKVTAAGAKIERADSAVVLKSESNFHIVPLDPNRASYYKTVVYAITDDNKKSQSAESIIYAGVYEDISRTIDQYSATAQSANSGFGWDASTGLGTQYAFSSTNASNIDLHLKMVGSTLTFYSPDAATNPALSGARTTKIGLVGTGQTAYDKAENLDEPNMASIAVAVDNVYLIKTKDNIYVKVWVKKAQAESGHTYQTVTFDFKIQPIAGFRVLKSSI